MNTAFYRDNEQKCRRAVIKHAGWTNDDRTIVTPYGDKLIISHIEIGNIRYEFYDGLIHCVATATKEVLDTFSPEQKKKKRRRAA